MISRCLFVLPASVAALALWTAVPASAEPTTYELDKPHTQIKFTVNRQGLSDITGWFGTFDGEIVLDEANPANSKVKATIRTESINTGFERRDQHLRSPDFFNAQEFPTMVFESSRVEKIGENTGRITGDLTLLGTKKPVTLDVVFNGKKPHPRSGKAFIGFKATGTLKRSDYGMNFIIGPVSDEVRITLDVLAAEK